MATRDQNQHARGGLNHLRAWKRLTIVAWDGSVMCSTRYSTVQLLSVYDHTSSWHKPMSWWQQWWQQFVHCVLPPCPVWRDSQPTFATYLSSGWARTDLQWDPFGPGCFDLTYHAKASVAPNKPQLSALNTQSKWHCHSFYHHCETKYPHSRATCKMGLKERRNGSGGVHSGQGGFLKNEQGHLFISCP